MEIRLFVLLIIACLTLLRAHDSTQVVGDNDLSLEDLLNLKIESTGFFSMDAAKVPGTVYVVSEDDLEQTSARDLGEILDFRIPGIYGGVHAMHGPLFGVRGIAIDNNGKTLVMQDGQILNGRTHYGYPFYSLPLLGDIQSVEIINGPGAIVHGSGAINGFVNIIPKNGLDDQGTFIQYRHGFKENLHQFEMGHGSHWNTGYSYVYAGMVQAQGFVPEDFHGFVGQKLEDREWYQNGTYQEQKDLIQRLKEALQQQTSAGNSAQAIYTQTLLQEAQTTLKAFQDTAAMYQNYYVEGIPEPSYRISANIHQDVPLGKLGLQALLQYHSFYSNGDYWASTDPSWGKQNHRINAQLAGRIYYDIELNEKNTLSLTGSGDAETYGVEYHTPYGNLIDGTNEEHWEMKTIYRNQMFSNTDIAIGGLLGKRMFDADSNRILRFILPRSTTIEEELFLKTDSAFDEYDDKMNGLWREWALFSEVTMSLGSLTMISGLRYDRVMYGSKPWELLARERGQGVPINDQGHVSPRLALSYQINNRNTVKASYQEGFRYPDAAYYHWWMDFNKTLFDVAPFLNDFAETEHLFLDINQNEFGLLPELEPEVMRSIEVNYHTETSRHRASLDINAYVNFFEDMLQWTEEIASWDDLIFYEGQQATDREGKTWESKTYQIETAEGTKSFFLYADPQTGELAPQSKQEELTKIPLRSLFVQQMKGWFGHFGNAEGTFASIGTDLILTLLPTKNVELKISYSFSRPAFNEDVRATLNFQDSASFWRNFPTHLFKMDFTQKLMGQKVFLSLEPFWQFAVMQKDDNGGLYEGTAQRWWLNVKMGYFPHKNWGMEIGGVNLLGCSVPPAFLGATKTNGIWDGALGTDEPQIYVNVKVKL